ncbi:2-dehydro-3-deoxygalactonokinase [Roseomonas sp. CECT 9278]|uniref:2-dehydro-3-deoxygalactonokinase n=1 Tax=Roseomonas sp. CECT 9278 TaxID=2845823 RepID=UPI001E5D9E4C|nr:2-dehydro-3-deoxygalactonokinase [Roseomonas sp. CECT 9278]CAH0135800.1 putative 2-dehydro-3-deoxygalactonokinase DgoK1 [Roseomonas sp. CECT 9278]
MIGIDWGTTGLRAYRLAPDGTVLARRETPRGILGIEPGGFPDALRASAGDWIDKGDTRVLVSGMAGSRQGWVEAPYLPCPADLDGLAEATVAVPFDGAEVRIVPGLCCLDRHGVPEVMRGEETQMLGALAGAEAATVCLPGSHSKWATMAGGAVTGFATHLTGEAYAALSGHTILARMMDPGAPADPAAFARGVARAKQPGGLLHHLFGLRAASLFDEITEAEAASFLSGLLVGHEVAAALEGGVAPPVILVGAPALTARYAAALDAFGVPHRSAAPDAAARGLHLIATRLAAWRP